MGYSFAPITDRNGLITLCVIFSITSTTVVVLRFYARKCKGLRLQADDWLIAISLVIVYPQWQHAPAVVPANQVLVTGVRPWSKCNVSRWYAPGPFQAASMISKLGYSRMRPACHHRSLSCREQLADLDGDRAYG